MAVLFKSDQIHIQEATAQFASPDSPRLSSAYQGMCPIERSSAVDTSADALADAEAALDEARASERTAIGSLQPVQVKTSSSSDSLNTTSVKIGQIAQLVTAISDIGKMVSE
jgi:hypothetical protein